MRAVTWQGKGDVRVETVPDPVIEESNDVIVRITASGICGSDRRHLHARAGPRRPLAHAGGGAGHAGAASR